MYSNRLLERLVSSSLKSDQAFSLISLSKDDTAKITNSLEPKAHVPDMRRAFTCLKHIQINEKNVLSNKEYF